jgi:hypothetical protein
MVSLYLPGIESMLRGTRSEQLLRHFSNKRMLQVKSNATRT